MTPPPEDDFLQRRNKALKRYDDEIQWYERTKKSQRLTFQFIQFSVILFSGLTPLLLLIPDCPKLAAALPAAVAGMLTAITATFRFQDNYIRFAYTAEMLKSEKLKFETRSTKDYRVAAGDQEAFEIFVSRMEELIINEVTDWRQTAVKKDKEDE